MEHRMTSFAVTILREPNYAVLRTDSYINKLAAEQIKQEVESLIEHGCRRFIINFARSSVINSLGLSVLISVIERTLDVQGILVFTDLTQVNAETMETMGLTQYARVMPTEEEARHLIEQASPP
jgi:anti-anti-sigma factor